MSSTIVKVIFFRNVGHVAIVHRTETVVIFGGPGVVAVDRSSSTDFFWTTRQIYNKILRIKRRVRGLELSSFGRFFRFIGRHTVVGVRAGCFNTTDLGDVRNPKVNEVLSRRTITLSSRHTHASVGHLL